MGDDKATKPTTKALNAVCGLFNSRLKRNLKNTESRLDKGSFRKIGPLNLLSIHHKWNLIFSQSGCEATNLGRLTSTLASFKTYKKPSLSHEGAS